MNRPFATIACAISFLAALVLTGCSEDGETVDWDSVVDPTVAPTDLDYSKDLIVYEATGRGRKIVDVWVVDPDTGDRARLTDGQGYNVGPAWSPDRERIVFASKRDGQKHTDVYTMARDGTDIQRLTNSEGSEYEPRFAPDGSSIAFARQEGKEWVLSLMDPDGSNIRDLTEPIKFIEFPAWHPDGDYIIFAAIHEKDTTDIFGVSTQGGDMAPVIASDANDLCPHFTPDGEMIYFAMHREGTENVDIYAIDADSGDVTAESAVQITDAPGRDDYGEPNPDGTRIVFASNRDDGNYELYLMDTDGSNQTRLTETPHIRENLPDW